MLNFSKSKTKKSKKKGSLSFSLRSQKSSAPAKKSTPMFAKFSFAAAHTGSAASLFDNEADLADDAPLPLNAQLHRPDERESGHPQWLQHGGEAEDDMQSQSGEADGYISADTCGEETAEPVERAFDDLEAENEDADRHGAEREVDETAQQDEQHLDQNHQNEEHLEEDDAEQHAANINVQSEAAEKPDNKADKHFESGQVPQQEEPKSPTTAKAKDDARASPTKRRLENEEMEMADSDSTRPPKSRSDDCENRSPKKRQRQSEDSPFEGTPVCSQPPLHEKTSSLPIAKTKKVSMMPQTPQNNTNCSALKERPLSSDNVNCVQTPLPPMPSGKTIPRSPAQQTNARKQVQTPQGSFGVAKMYADFKARFGELLDLDAKRDQQNRDIRMQILAGSERDSKIVERWIQEERQKHVAHQRHVEEMLAKIKATLARGMKRTAFTMNK